MDSGHHVYMEHYYVSPELLTELELLNTYACGTLRKKTCWRTRRPEKTKLKLKQGKMIFRKRDNIIAVNSPSASSHVVSDERCRVIFPDQLQS